MSREQEYWQGRAAKLEEKLRHAEEQVGFWREMARLADERAKKAEKTR